MVAEAVLESPSAQKRGVSRNPSGRPKGVDAVSINVPTKLRVRSLYVSQGLSPSAIAPKVKLTEKQIYDLVCREGWSKEKAEVKRKVTEEYLARTREQVDEVIDATAMLAEEGSIAGLLRAVECTTKKSKFAAKDFASWAAGSRQLVAIARQARGLEGEANGKGGDINLLFISCPRAGDSPSEPEVKPEKNVTPPVDVSAQVLPSTSP